MSQGQFEEYRRQAVPRYAEDNVTAGAWDADVALEKAERTFARLLPEGIATENHHFSSIVDDDGSCVGMIWFVLQVAENAKSAFICDFEIYDRFRRRGYGKRALVALEEKLQREGVSKVSLHVFAHNQAARSLYERLGYVSTGINMTKPLTTADTDSG
jgi:ribosomal protein S18 acetylase RimI-like enzyme